MNSKPFRMAAALLVVTGLADAAEAEDTADRQAPLEAMEFEVTCRESGTVTGVLAKDRLVISIRGGKGIGKATFRRTAGAWPSKIIVRAYLGGLESLKLSCGDKRLAIEVQSHGDHHTLLTFSQGGAKDEELGKDSPYRTQVVSKDPKGHATPAPPPKGGWFEITVPKALLEGAKELNLDWIDFYR